MRDGETWSVGYGMSWGDSGTVLETQSATCKTINVYLWMLVKRLSVTICGFTFSTSHEAPL